MAEFNLTLDNLYASTAKAIKDKRMDDDGAVFLTFESQTMANKWIKAHHEFHYVDTGRYVAANIDGDFCIIAEVPTTHGDKTIRFIVHGLQDWIPTMKAIAIWRELPDELSLAEVSRFMKMYQQNSDHVRKGLYTLIGSSARRVGNPDSD